MPASGGKASHGGPIELYEAPLWQAAGWSLIAVPFKVALYRRFARAARRAPHALAGLARGRGAGR